MRDLARRRIDDRHRAPDAGSGNQSAIVRRSNADDRRRPGREIGQRVALPRQQVEMTIGAAASDLAAGQHRHRVLRRRQRTHHRIAARHRPDSQCRVIAGADQKRTVRRESNIVDILAVAFEHARFAAGDRPQANATVPRRGRDRLAVRRYRQPGDRPLMSSQDRIGLRPPGRPDRDPAILAAGDHPPVGQKRHRVHRALVETQNLRGGILRQRPPDRRGVEAARQRRLAVRRDRQRANRAAVAAQLRLRRHERGQHEQNGKKKP
jgi:hypothetical protein